MRILLGTNQLQKDAGAEVLLAKFALHCRKAGADVVVYANWDGFPMTGKMQKARIPIVTEPGAIRPLDFDLVYFQHQVAGLFDYTPHPENAERSLVVFAKLASEGFMESSGWELENALGDLIFARSPETAAVAAAQGSTLPIHMFYNAVAGDFGEPRSRALPSSPQRVVAVACHPESDLNNALQLLGDQVQVQHFARTSDLAKAGAAAQLLNADLVIGLGQTVHYALATRTPIYIHNQYGGPGYLSGENFEAAEKASFSGRCTSQTRSAQAIAADLMIGYEEGRRFVTSLPGDIVDRYSLARQFDRLLRTPRTSNAERQERLARIQGAISRERYLAEYVRSTHRKIQMLSRMTKA